LGVAMTDPKSLQFDTLSVWAAEEGPFPYGAAVTPIYSASTFAHESLD